MSPRVPGNAREPERIDTPRTTPAVVDESQKDDRRMSSDQNVCCSYR
jgi:hypothetical protein